MTCDNCRGEIAPGFSKIIPATIPPGYDFQPTEYEVHSDLTVCFTVLRERIEALELCNEVSG